MRQTTLCNARASEYVWKYIDSARVCVGPLTRNIPCLEIKNSMTYKQALIHTQSYMCHTCICVHARVLRTIYLQWLFLLQQRADVLQTIPVLLLRELVRSPNGRSIWCNTTYWSVVSVGEGRKHWKILVPIQQHVFVFIDGTWMFYFLRACELIGAKTRSIWCNTTRWFRSTAVPCTCCWCNCHRSETIHYGMYARRRIRISWRASNPRRTLCFLEAAVQRTFGQN